VTAQDENGLTERQLEIFGRALHSGSVEASDALGRWIGKPTRIQFDGVEQLSLPEASGVLGEGDELICFCAAQMRGRLAGQIVVAFEDTSGLALADLLLNQPRGTAAEWGEMETSAVLETTNILGCAYLNSLARTLPVDDGAMSELLPSPPRFSRDFAQSLIEFTLMDQIVISTRVLLARIEFRIDGEPVDWTVLLVPDAASMLNLRELL
jgi:chemotaxis protein CheC